MEPTKKKAKPCKDHFLVMPDESEMYSEMCDACGWKLSDGGWYLRPVKLENRYYFDH